MNDQASPSVVGKSPGLLGEGTPAFLTSKVDFLVNWARRNSLWPMPLGTACCGIEMMASYASDFDLARFGMERMSFSPRQADVLICAGRVPYKLAPVLAQAPMDTHHLGWGIWSQIRRKTGANL